MFKYYFNTGSVFQQGFELGRKNQTLPFSQNNQIEISRFPKRARFNVESFQQVEEIENDLFQQEEEQKTQEILEKIRKLSKIGENTGKQNVTLQHVFQVNTDSLQHDNTERLSGVLHKGWI